MTPVLVNVATRAVTSVPVGIVTDIVFAASLIVPAYFAVSDELNIIISLFTF
jgi:hypothetical protein